VICLRALRERAAVTGEAEQQVILTRPKQGDLKMRKHIAAVAAAVAMVPFAAFASPYAGEVSVSGTTGTFYLNEPADNITVTYDNGASFQVISGATAGAKNFTLPSAGSTFQIAVLKNSTAGWTSGASLLIGTDTTSTTFNSPRGVAVNQTPGQYFGRIYVSNSAAGAVTSAASITRTLGDGIYVLHADQTDGVGQGDTALTAGLNFGGTSNSPYQINVGPDNNLYIGDGSTVAGHGNIYRADPNVSATSGTTLLKGFPGSSTATADADNHGFFLSKPIVSISGGNVSIHAIDGSLGAPNSTNNPTATALYNSIRRYDVGPSPAPGNPAGPAALIPQTFISNPLADNPGTSGSLNTFSGGLGTDLARGPSDGRFYYMEARNGDTPGPGGNNQAGLYVVDGSTGATLFDSLAVSQAMAGNDPNAIDLIQRVNSVAVSPDNKYVAFIQVGTTAPNAVGNDVLIVPLTATIGSVTGLPDLTNIIRITDAFPDDAANGRSLNFDAAGNLYAVSSGDGMMRVLSPGGATEWITSFDGTNYSFAVPEPGSLALLGIGGIALLQRRRRGA
jgi:sugar lactone lactonase YvrE